MIYKITDLGGASSERSSAAAINALGQVVVQTGGSSLQGNGINDAGAVVGTTYTASGSYATSWNGGTATVLSSLGGAESWALSVNNAGYAVGASQGVDGRLHAVSWSGGLNDLGFLPGGGWSSAYAINQAGAIAGTSETASSRFHAFLWTANGGMRDLGTLGGGLSYGLGISAWGSVVGSSQVQSGYLHAFVWNPEGLMIDLGTLGGGSSFAYGMSDSGLIVGSSFVRTSENTHAFLYTGGVMLDLNAITAGLGGWELTEASGINANGQIAGTGLLNGVERAFRLDPLVVSSVGVPVIHNPEPGTWLLLLTGFSALVAGVRRRMPAVPGSSRR
jgi:probable HAF family extracellular repeat protein